MADISVIIPCYNVAPYIDRCLTTITSQTIGMNALEIICIDDASTDGTWQHLQAWEQNYPDNIILVRCDKNSRQGTARNIGLQYASADWIAFIDSDDWVELDYFEKLYSIAIQCQCDIVSCDHFRDASLTLTYLSNRENGRNSGLVLIDTVLQRKKFIVNESIGLSAPGKLIRTSLLIDYQLTFPENIAYEDILWGSLLYFYADSVYILEEYLYHYFLNPSSTVLTRNADYHVDILTISLMAWNEWQNRCLFHEYNDELEFLFLDSCYFIFMKMLSMRQDTPSFSLFQLSRKLVFEHIPDFRSNPYADKLTDFHKILLDLLWQPLNRSDFLTLTETAKEYWKYNR